VLVGDVQNARTCFQDRTCLGGVHQPFDGQINDEISRAKGYGRLVLPNQRKRGPCRAQDGGRLVGRRGELDVIERNAHAGEGKLGQMHVQITALGL